jgi:four helix bundle protein
LWWIEAKNQNSKPMTEQEMKQRTKAFALRAIKVARNVSKDFVGRRLGDQLLRCGTSVAANYRAACRARSVADFINKLGIAEEESDESALWMELLTESGLVPPRRLEKLLDEANQITAILVASKRTSRARR